MKVTTRHIHIYISYFYIGLIIAFSISGIILNHRDDIYPMDYVYETREVAVKLPREVEGITKDFIKDFSKRWDVTYDGSRIRNDNLRVYYEENAILDVSINTGIGELEFSRKVPVIGHSMYLHKSTNRYWIWYSDIFGAAILVIAITGMMTPAGKKVFKNSGWMLALAGMAFPVLVLIVTT